MDTPQEEHPDADDPEAIAQFLAAPIASVWNAFDRGRASADDFFAAEDYRAFDPHLWAHISRYEAMLALQAESPDDWELIARAHSGLEVVMEPYHVRIYKAFGDGPQNPGHSLTRKAFFQQFRMTLFGGSATTNLILYWRVMGGDLDLGLCKPKGLWLFKGTPKLEWQLPISYDPLAGLSFPGVDDNDLPLRLEREDELGEEEAEE